ncbi:MAG TPA: glycoside hydrolase family 32 protein [Planctomycetaceae bacterium]|nr:glycoside hydrolase family 32 protein [Planctomycetaceae bacterium]
MTRLLLLSIACQLSLTAGAGPAAADEPENRPDILIADFESEDYGDWTVTGEAFGPGPARGALAGQMHVDGFRGERLVNSFYGGDDATGTLTSPALRLERKFVNFLIGGGRYAGETCINLIVGGEVFRTATGPNDAAGGSERLDWHTWDVSELEGRTARIEIVDRRKGGWGHINVDHIVHSDRRLQPEPAAREISVEQRYVHLPVKRGAAKRRMSFRAAGHTVREFEIELADGEPDFFTFADVAPWRGQRLRIEVDRLPPDSNGLKRITQSDELPATDELYRERHRPQFHFTSRRGWLNDPNGMVYHDGEWHLFYQHNPYGTEWGNMHWGHAVSRDLVHWRELPIGLYPRRFGDWAFSGSAVVDTENSSGFGKGGEPPLVLAYTSTGRGECIAWSTDRGRTWTEYEGNPVVRHRGRDPRLVWHEPTKRWVMAVYTETDSLQSIAFHTSTDLKQWTYQSRIDGYFECPDLFELPVQGAAAGADASGRPETKWVLYAADGRYVLGRFDGKTFHPETDKQTLWHGNFYAAQTFSNAPDGRRIQIGWGRGITFPGMPFNQQMTVPVELTLRTTDEGVRMFAEPARELETLRGRAHARAAGPLRAGESPLEGVEGELFDLHAEFETGTAESVGLEIRGVPVEYNAREQQIHCRNVKVPLKPEGGVVHLRILADRGSLEIFGNQGRIAVSVGAIPPAGEQGIRLTARGGEARLRSLRVHELTSAWRP